nr:nitroreductase family protein [Alistipes sp.]
SVVCSTVPEDRDIDIDLGISAQSMLLQAVEMGLSGICIGAFDREAVTAALGLEYRPLLIVAVGRSAEKIELVDRESPDRLAYYRKDGVHCVPKLRLDDLIIGR